MIILSNGHSFEYLASSGALGFDGQGWPWEKPLKWLGLLDPSLFTVVIKTLTWYPTKGNLRWYNPLGSIRLIRNGVVNAVGLSNPGIDRWCREVAPRLDFSYPPLIASIASDSLLHLQGMAERLNDFDFMGMELNTSCPTSESGLIGDDDAAQKIIERCETVKRFSRFPLILKLSVTHDLEAIVPAVEGMVDAFSINSVPWARIFPDKRSPLAALGGGGVSGKAAQPFTWKTVELLSQKTKVPVIGPSIWEFSDIAKLRQLGAKAIGFGSIFLRYPWRPTLFVRRDRKERKK